MGKAMIQEYQHKRIGSTAWEGSSIVNQLANIGSEIYRATNWAAKGKPEFSVRAFERSLELIDISIESICRMPQRTEGQGSRKAALREMTRLREVVCDYFVGDNEYGTDPESLNKYFYHFAIANNNGK